MRIFTKYRKAEKQHSSDQRYKRKVEYFQSKQVAKINLCRKCTAKYSKINGIVFKDEGYCSERCYLYRNIA